MFWRYLFFTFLVGVPTSRIFTSASVHSAYDSALSEDELVDRIVDNLKGRTVDNPNGDQSSDSQASTYEKKDETENNNVEVNAAKDDGTAGSESSNSGSETYNTDGNTNEEELSVGTAGKTAPLSQGHPGSSDSNDDDTVFIAISTGCAIVGFIGLMLAGVCYYKFRKSSKAAINVEYPAYGVTGPMKERVPSPGDRKLAQSAQMYHYQHQKQQMIAMEKANGDMKHDASDDDSEEDNVEGDYTVYECPGLAPTGEMEVKNPLFRGDETPVTPNKETVGQPNKDPGSPEGGEH